MKCLAPASHFIFVPSPADSSWRAPEHHLARSWKLIRIQVQQSTVNRYHTWGNWCREHWVKKINKLSTTLFLSFVLNDAWLTLLLCFDIVLCYMESLNCSCSFLVWSIKSWFETSIHITVLKPPLLWSTEDFTIAKRGLHLYANLDLEHDHAMTVIAWRLQ